MVGEKKIHGSNMGSQQQYGAGGDIGPEMVGEEENVRWMEEG